MNLQTRQSIEEVKNERLLIDSLGYFTGIFNSISTVTVVLNSNRQIIFASNDFLKTFQLTSEIGLLGERTGEVISCVHSKESPYGCGNSTSCNVCGLLNTILQSGKTNEKVTKEARITTVKKGITAPLELSVTSAPVRLASSHFYIVTLTDISSEKRKLQLEKIFIHDLVNSAGGISGLSDILEFSENEESKKEVVDIIGKASKVLLEQILSFRNILSAESGELEVTNLELQSNDVIDEASSLISSNKELKANIAKFPNSENITLISDRVLLSRILVNMLKNAAEAEGNADSVISIGSTKKGGIVRFWVNNKKAIPEDVQKQIFQRSFSTKGSNRGLGTYSMKLLGENYLKGNVGFTSNEAEGTFFYVELPCA
jgi:K+-sensing histidine kinase KdpD